VPYMVWICFTVYFICFLGDCYK